MRASGAPSLADYEKALEERDPQQLKKQGGRKTIRGLVSKKKKRFKAGKYDLDLAYISHRIIAMGYPSGAIEGFYRNKASTVKSFLEGAHHQHYKVYNLCSEKVYPHDRFPHYSHYPFDDHNCPSLPLIDQCLADCNQFLDAFDTNTVFIHCKAGKGRTGLMICCLLCQRYPTLFPTSDDALDFYGRRRTYDGNGVTIQSQRRYVHYYVDYLRKGKDITEKVKLSQVKIRAEDAVLVSMIGMASLRIHNPALTPSYISSYPMRQGQDWIFPLRDVIPDLHGELYVEVILGGKTIAYFWLHCSFLEEETVLSRTELDGKIKKKKMKKKYPGEVSVTVGRIVPAEGKSTSKKKKKKKTKQ